MIRQNLKFSYAILIIAAIFIVWSAIFIYQASFIAIDGKRYANLFDDAMISMRYAWNFAHGLGLVWNPGEYIEGYTNLLMTLLMSLVIFVVEDKRLAVLAINISGILFMLGNAYTTMLIAGYMRSGEQEWSRKWLKVLVFATVLFYYPLSYWSLMGMETGLITLLMLLGILKAFKYVQELDDYRQLLLSATYLGLAYLTRPDALIAAGMVFLYISFELRRLNKPRSYWLSFFGGLGWYALFIIGQQIFRLSYYGEWTPNTFVLKATGMPLSFRLADGISYIIPFIQSSILVVALMAIGFVFNCQRPRIFLLSMSLAYFGYQIWIGGDAFPPYWRIIVPVMPLMLALAIQGAMSIVHFIIEKMRSKQHSAAYATTSVNNYKGFIVSLIAILMLLLVNIFFLAEMIFYRRPHEAVSNEYHVNTAIALNELTTQSATVGVSSAGIVPYYTEDRVAIDFLGKSDKYIARLPPDLSGGARYGSIFSLPGHNKYDLNYSIKTLQPTYIQITGWGSQNITEWVEQRYSNIEYKGVRLYLRKDSAAVLWDKIEAFSKQ